jgi:hypothetical protein
VRQGVLETAPLSDILKKSALAIRQKTAAKNSGKKP